MELGRGTKGYHIICKLKADCTQTMVCDFILNFHHIKTISGSPPTLFGITCVERMLRNVRKCTVEVGRYQSWDVALFELKKFIRLVVARGVIEGRNFRVKILWGMSWGCEMISRAMANNIRFLELMRYLRFDQKTENRRNLLHDKCAFTSQVCNSFVENFHKVFFPQHVQHYSG